jgi:carboxylesterase
MSKSSDDDPLPPRRRPDDLDAFFFPGGGVSALLIHGLTGTPYEMRYLGERLAAAGVRVCGVKLAGHAGEPQELADATYNHWYESVVAGFERLRGFGDPNVVVGLSAGAVLAARLALDQREDVAGLAMLAPAFFLPRPATIALSALKILGSLTQRIYIRGSGSDIHDDAARSIHPTCHLMPLSAPINLLQLSALVRSRLPRLSQPVLVIHSHRDHTCPYDRNIPFLTTHLGSAPKRFVELAESYHVITVDTEKERVAGEVLEFVEQFRVLKPRKVAAIG